jgi:hypothetical protein
VIDGLGSLLAVYAPFAILGLAVLAAFAVSASLRGKAERRQLRERQRDERAKLLRPHH